MRLALVDSDKAAQRSLLRLLAARGHEVAAFSNSGEALETIRDDWSLDALIAAAELAPISGVELCWETRLLAGRQRPFYILLSCPHEDQRTRIEALDGGADDVIGQPPLAEELYARLRVAERVLILQRELIQLATTDPLTGVRNRRAFFEAANQALEETGSDGTLSAILIDIDRFKAINDHYGHDAGDQAICAIADEAKRDGAIVGRLGGDEFSVLLKGHSLAEALSMAEQLRQRLAGLRFPTSQGRVGLTCSLGVSELHAGDSVDDLLKRADLALYRAKCDGRNRVATPPVGPWIGERPPQGVSLARSLARIPRDSGDRRRGLPASEALLARICAVVDLLIASGLSEAGAAQAMTQRMMAAGVIIAESDMETRGWKTLLDWRARILDGEADASVLAEYHSVKAAIDAIPPHERVERVLEEELWNRRRAERHAQH